MENSSLPPVNPLPQPSPQMNNDPPLYSPTPSETPQPSLNNNSPIIIRPSQATSSEPVKPAESYSPNSNTIPAQPTVLTPLLEDPTPPSSPFVSPTQSFEQTPPLTTTVNESTPVVSMTPPEFVGDSFTKSTKKPKKKLILVLSGSLVILVGVFLAIYFLYYMKPSVIWSDSIGHMNIAYSRLVDYANTESSSKYKGIVETGSFKVKDGTTNYSGNISINSYGSNSNSSASLDLGTNTISMLTRTVAVPGFGEPDVYIQFNGVQSLLNDYFGATAPNLSGQWILIDHNLLADLDSIIAKNQKAQSAKPVLTSAEINSFLQQTINVNKEYLFTANQNHAVTKVIKNFGFETINGYKTYHYKIGFNKDNIKSYIVAMCGVLQQSQFGNYLKEELSATSVSTQCKNLENSTSKINSSDTIDVWADTSNRLIYKVRASETKNPAENYVDIGLDYKSGYSFPLFISGQTGSGGSLTTFSVNLNLDSKTNKLALIVGLKSTSSSSPLSISGSFSFEPNNQKVNVSVPANAESIATVANQLGLGQYLTSLESLGTNTQSAFIKPGLTPYALTALIIKDK